MITDWNDLQTLLAIEENGSLSAAARALGVSQSTVSRRLQSIENVLQRRLFVQTRARGLVAADTTRALIEAARKMRDAFREVSSATTGAPAPVRIASCEVTARTFMDDALGAWASANNPAADLAVHDDLFALPDNDFDIMVTPLESAPQDMVGRRIGTIDWALFAAPAYLEPHPWHGSAPALGGHRVIHASGSLAGIEACRWFAGLGGEVSFLASSPLAQQEAAARGLGVAMLPRALAGDDPRLVGLDFPGCPVSDVWMLARRAEAANPRVGAFLRWARKYFAAQAAAATATARSSSSSMTTETS